MPVPVTERPTSVATALLSAIVEVPPPRSRPASVRGPGTGLPPPSRQVPAGWAGTVCATQLAGRSMNALSPGPGYSSLPSASLASGVFGPVGSQCTSWPNSVSPAESDAMRGRGVRRDDRRVREAVAGEGERREGLVEGDVDQAAVLERRGRLDLGDDVLEEQVRRVQAAGEVDRRRSACSGRRSRPTGCCRGRRRRARRCSCSARSS